MGIVGLVPEPNLWNKPILLGKIIGYNDRFFVIEFTDAVISSNN